MQVVDDKGKKYIHTLSRAEIGDFTTSPEKMFFPCVRDSFPRQARPTREVMRERE